MFSVSLIPVDVGMSVRKQRVVIYARVSTIKEEQESSYELQVDELIKSVESNPSYELVCVYADKESGRNIKNRPSFNRMLELARIGGIDIIYTKSVSRFGRNAIEVPEIIRELRGLGVTVIFDKENISTKDFGNEFLLNILSGVAEEESLQISTNLRWTFSKKMSKGGNTTFSIYGYKIVDNQFHIVPEEADVVR
ncbi:MAG: recombinase family protein [Candidatus Cloacimonadaceae bacterium]|jgi:DNA invertase Pin-like site-specific DNA recombinase|nr:recombinase family protein [Bacilli bacterium]